MECSFLGFVGCLRGGMPEFYFLLYSKENAFEKRATNLIEKQIKNTGKVFYLFPYFLVIAELNKNNFIRRIWIQ